MTRAPTGLSQRALWDWIGAGTLAALLACFGVADQMLVLGSRDGGWTYGYVGPFFPGALAAAAAAAGLAAVLVYGSGNRQWPALLAWLLFAFGIQALVRSVAPLGLEPIFASDNANGFYGVTRLVGPGEALRDFDRLRTSWPLHANSNMPGKLLFLYALEMLTRHPAALAWLVVFVSNAGAVLMYVLVQDLFADSRAALYSAILYLLVPAKLFFMPLLNTVTPVVALASAVLLVKWLGTARASFAAALGASLFVLVLFEPLPLVMGLLFALLTVRAAWLGQITGRQILSHVAIGAAAWAAAYGAMRLLTGFDALGAFRQLQQEAVRFNDAVGRPYLVWVGANLFEFLFGAGVCQVLLVGAALADGWRQGGTWRERATQPILVVSVGVLLVLLVTDVLGINRGEVTRLWVFLACFFQIPAAYVCGRLENRGALILVSAVTILQATLGTAMIGFAG